MDGETPILKQAIQEMKASEVECSALLNTCRLIEKSGVTYGMSLLALCGFHERKEMMDLLLKEGAGNIITVKYSRHIPVYHKAFRLCRDT